MDRVTSQEEDNKIDTQVEIAKMYAYVSDMPESSKKRKLLKQVNNKFPNNNLINLYNSEL